MKTLVGCMSIISIMLIVLTTISINVDSQDDIQTVVTGYVYDKDSGDPLAGARVRVYNGVVAVGDTTDQYGYYYFDLPTPREREMDISAQKDGYYDEWKTIEVSLDDYIEIDFDLIEKTCMIYGTVYAAESSDTISGATVRLYTSDDQYEEKINADDRGNFHFYCSPGEYYLTCDEMGFKYQTGDTITIEEGEEIGYDFHMEMEDSMISGYITNKWDAPLPGATVILRSDHLTIIDHADERGYFDTSVDPGDLMIEVYYTGYQKSQTEVFIPEGEDVEVDIVMERITLSSSFETLKEILMMIFSSLFT